MKTVEIFYFDGCPTWQRAVEQVRHVIAQAGLQEEAAIQTVRVETDDQAKRARFLGSPTVRVNGQDVEPASQGRTDFGLQCRVYEYGGRLSGLPSSDLIRTALGVGEGSCL